jgi:UDP-glucuronate decarboxylase
VSDVSLFFLCVFYYFLVFRNGVVITHEQSITHESINMLIQSGIRDHLVNAVKSESASGTSFPPVKSLPDNQKIRILVTGGSGFVGSHLVDRLMMAGHQVIVVDNMFTGRQKNVAQWIGHHNFQLIIHDVVEPIMLEVDQIYHLACPASPPHYQVYIICFFFTFFGM